jgi:hypothetical protein
MSPASLSGQVPINQTGGGFKAPASLQQGVENAPQYLLMLKILVYILIQIQARVAA